MTRFKFIETVHHALTWLLQDTHVCMYVYRVHGSNTNVCRGGVLTVVWSVLFLWLVQTSIAGDSAIAKYVYLSIHPSRERERERYTHTHADRGAEKKLIHWLILATPLQSTTDR